jgi:hypothetical protein
VQAGSPQAGSGQVALGDVEKYSHEKAQKTSAFVPHLLLSKNIITFFFSHISGYLQ